MNGGDVDKDKIEQVLQLTVVPAGVLIFCGMFYASASGLRNLAFAYPRFLILVIVGLTLLQILVEVVRMVRGQAMGPPDPEAQVNTALIASLAIVLLAVYMAPITGLSLATTGLMLVLYFWLFRGKVPLIVAISLITAALLYGVFVMLFDLPLNRIR